MSFLLLHGERLPARRALVEAIETAWSRLASAGTWWTGAERLAIAAETRAAESCAHCEKRKQSLSPHGVIGQHDGCGSGLSAEAIDAVHRLKTDASRITERWVRDVSQGPLGEDRYVEAISVVAMVTMLDTFDDALGRPQRSLPHPIQGEPTRQRPSGARRDLAWVATLAPEFVQDVDPNPYPLHGDKNIHRALSLVPREVMNFFDLDVEFYLKDHEIRDFANEYRAITHAQIELVAARASALNRCYY